MGYLTSGKLGANLDSPTTTQDFALGERSLGSDGTEYVYVQASGALTAYYAAGIDENYQCAPLSNTTAAGTPQPAYPQVAFADNDYGWVPVRGSNISVKTRASCAADVLLYTTASAGRLDDTVGGSGIAIEGIVLVVAASSSASAGSTVREVLATYPHLTEP
jgi:hypothetical protein